MKFPAICTLISTGKTVVCSDAGSFSTKTLVYGYPLDGAPEVSKPVEGVLITQDNAVEVFTEAKAVIKANNDDERFVELKAERVWLHGSDKEKEEYKLLKAKLNK